MDHLHWGKYGMFWNLDNVYQPLKKKRKHVCSQLLALWKLKKPCKHYLISKIKNAAVSSMVCLLIKTTEIDSNPGRGDFWVIQRLKIIEITSTRNDSVHWIFFSRNTVKHLGCVTQRRISSFIRIILPDQAQACPIGSWGKSL